MVKDSAYLNGFYPEFITVSLNAHNHVVQELLKQLKVLLQKHIEPIFINHIMFNSCLPGPLDQGK